MVIYISYKLVSVVHCAVAATCCCCHAWSQNMARVANWWMFLAMGRGYYLVAKRKKGSLWANLGSSIVVNTSDRTKVVIFFRKPMIYGKPSGNYVYSVDTTNESHLRIWHKRILNNYQFCNISFPVEMWCFLSRILFNKSESKGLYMDIYVINTYSRIFYY